jgi:diguanylate cyclase (GGDEF)-like protein/PAS domain S-box-containing protein
MGMSEDALYSEEYSMETDQERNKLLRYTVEVERELMKMKRTEKVLHEMEQRYLALMDSNVFLYAILSLDGAFRMMNRHAEEFFGFHLKFDSVTLQSLAGPGYTGEVENILADVQEKSSHILLPVIRAEGSLGWLDMEFCLSTYHGEPAVQIIASDITDLMKGGADGIPASHNLTENPTYALQILNSCPGFLCFAVDKSRNLLYATRGYREIAKRFLGHECAAGILYPSGLSTPYDFELHELIQGALQGDTRAVVLVERGANGDKQWNVTAAPLVASSGEIEGSVVHLALLAQFMEREPSLFSAKRPEADARSEAEKAQCELAEKVDAMQMEFLNAIPRMLFLVDDEARCVEVNAHFIETLKLERETVVGHSFTDWIMESDPVNERLLDKFLQAIRKDSLENLECKVCAKDGEILFLSLQGTRLQWRTESSGIVPLTLVSCVDNTKLHRTEEQLKRVSTTDLSTGTLNRQGMERALSSEIERAVRYRGSLSLIILDIDGFRLLNERIGYAASDRLLRELVTALKSRIRLTDFLGRWSGDEFMILTPLPGATAYQLAEKLRDMVQHNTFGEGASLTLSAGVAEYRKPMDISAFAAAAYDAMTEAKRNGGNRSVQTQISETEDNVREAAEG